MASAKRKPCTHKRAKCLHANVQGAFLWWCPNCGAYTTGGMSKGKLIGWVLPAREELNLPKEEEKNEAPSSSGVRLAR